MYSHNSPCRMYSSLVLALAGTAFGQQLKDAKLVASDAAEDDEFGNGVAT